MERQQNSPVPHGTANHSTPTYACDPTSVNKIPSWVPAFFVGLSFLCFAGWSDAGTNQWTTNGPLGGRINTLGIASDKILAGTYNGGVYVSTDGGASWTQMSGGLPKSTEGNYPDEIVSIAVSPDYANDGSVFAAAYRCGIYNIRNGFTNWTAVNGGLTIEPVWQPLFAWELALSPDYEYDRTIFLSAGTGVLKSVADPPYWMPYNFGIPGIQHYTTAIAVSPNYKNDRTAMVFQPGSNTGGLCKTTDGGANWTRLTDSVLYNIYGVPYDISAIVFSPNYASDQTVFISTMGDGVFKSINGGQSWASIGIVGSIVHSLALSPDFNNNTGAGIIFAGADTLPNSPPTGGIFRSLDGGVHWIKDSSISGFNDQSSFYDARAVAFSYDWANDHAIYVGASDGVYSYTDSTAPSSGISAPAENQEVKGPSFNVIGTASDNAGGVGIKEVEVSINGGAWTKASDSSGDGSWSLWSYNLSSLQPGSYSITSRATDGFGNDEANGPVRHMQVLLLPTVTITSPANNAVLEGTTATISGTATDASGPGVASVQVGITPSGGTTTWYPATGTTSWSYNWTLPAKGPYTLQAVATDKNGNTGTPVSISVTIVTFPNSAITSPANGANLRGIYYTVAGTAVSAGSAPVVNVQVGITPNGGKTRWHTATGTTSWKYRWPLPKDGNYTIVSKATDKAGNVESPDTYVGVTVDKIRPTVAIAPLSNYNLSGTTAIITGTAFDAGSGVSGVQVGITPRGSTKTTWYSATGTTSWNCTWTLPTDRKYTIKAKAIDNAGNKKTTAAVKVMVDNTPPTVRITAPANNKVLNGTTETATISGRVSDAGSGVASVQVGITPSWGTTTWYPASGTTSWSYKWPVPAIDGSYTIQAMTTDEAGNIGYSSEPYTVIIKRIIAKIILLSPPDGAYVSTPFVLRWLADYLAIYYEVQFSTSSKFDSSDIGYAFSNSMTFMKLAPGTYYWRVRARVPSVSGWTMYSDTWKIIVR
jgi:hypothetical protein